MIPAHSLLDRTGNQGAFAEFILDANRKVTRLVLGQTLSSGTQRFFRLFREAFASTSKMAKSRSSP